MKFLFDVLPFVLFYVSYVQWGIYVATAVAIGASALQIVATMAMGHKVQTMQWVSMGLIAVFGGLALVLQNPIFIMWRSSVVNWLLAAILLGSMLVFKKNVLKALMGSQVRMPDFAWRSFTWGMAAMFICMGIANIVIAKNFSEAFWVNYKTFGSPVITFVVMFFLFMVHSRHIQAADAGESAEVAAEGKADVPHAADERKN